ncbi:MAG: CHAT domain-containing protein [Saprospiraceae bacterium]|nr:CHAT domain-containing protein [Saprospiraceae bacterium]
MQKVSLSACSSGLGKYISGEGTYSLPRYFMLNGANEVNYNLWYVED